MHVVEGLDRPSLFSLKASDQMSPSYCLNKVCSPDDTWFGVANGKRYSTASYSHPRGELVSSHAKIFTELNRQSLLVWDQCAHIEGNIHFGLQKSSDLYGNEWRYEWLQASLRDKQHDGSLQSLCRLHSVGCADNLLHEEIRRIVQ